MNNDSYKDIASGYGFNDRFAYAVEAFSRSIGFLDAADLERLSRARVAVPGLGGVGSAHVATLARLGIGAFHLADMDIYNPVNMNRQHGARVNTWGCSKLDTVAQDVTAINPFVELELFPNGLTASNLDAFLQGVDVVIDGLDFFVFDMRRKLFNRARELNIPVITAGPLGFSSALLVFTSKGMTFDEYFDVHDELPMEKKYLHFALGLAPAALHAGYMDSTAVDFQMRKGPSLIVGCQMSAALAATEAARLILNRKGLRAAPYYLQMDPYLKRIKKGKLRRGNRSPVQRLKAWAFEKFILAKSGRTGCQPLSAPSADFISPLDHDISRIQYLLSAGIQAPSGDNVQPWRFAVQGDEIRLASDFQADTSFFNTHQLATVISTGAAAENIRIAANACGMHCDVRVEPEASTGHMATLSFTPAPDAHENVLADSLWRRHTNRKPFSSKRVPAGIWHYLEDTADQLGDVQLEWINTPHDLSRLSAAIYQADRIRTERRDLHEHFMKMVRFTDEETLATRDGLPLLNLEAGLAGNLFLKATKTWKAANIANMLGIGRIVPLVSSLGIRQSGGVGVLSVPTVELADFFRGGMALERIWLAATHLNMRFQPMTAITLFQLRAMFNEMEQFTPKHRDLLAKASETLSFLFPATASRAPVMLFRLGFGPSIRYGTFRRDYSSFIR
ncbi:MAG: ThiF family adenylyltransferase [Halodesulfovibrio sp.]